MTDPTAAAPAATEPPAAAPAAPAAAPVAPAGHGIAWLPADADPELVGHVQNAGWQSPADAAKSHRELQRLFGADRHGRTVVVPKDDAPADEWAAFHARLGRPATPADYKIPVPAGADPKFAEGVAAQLHALGVSTKQGQALAAWWNEQAAASQQAAEAAQAEALQAEHAALAKDWGTGPDAAARTELAKRAAQTLGLDEAAIDALEKVSGFSKTMKALAKVGDMLRETGAEAIGDVGSFGMTPEGARAKRGQLMADKDWRAKAMNPQSREWAELQRMDRIISGN